VHLIVQFWHWTIDINFHFLLLSSYNFPSFKTSHIKSHKSLEPTFLPKLQVYFADFPYFTFSTQSEFIQLRDQLRLLVRYTSIFHSKHMFQYLNANVIFFVTFSDYFFINHHNIWLLFIVVIHFSKRYNFVGYIWH